MAIARQVGAKQPFDDIYAQPDPRGYFRGLGALDYEVPAHGANMFAKVLAAVSVERPTVIDLCCSYGVNAALLNHDLTLADLYERYEDEQIATLSTEELARADRKFYSDHRRKHRARVIGLDVSAPAIDYATRVGLLDAGFAENLELELPSDLLGAHAEEADLVTVTGGVGYITATTFGRLLACRTNAEPPWVATLCLRTVPYEPVAECLEQFGLVTEHLADVTFPQRRFASPTERDFALDRLSELGIDPSGKEEEGRYHVDVYLSVPRTVAATGLARSVLADIVL